MTDDIRAWHKTQIKKYVKVQGDYEKYAAHMRTVLEKLTASIAPLAMVQVRAKSKSSFAEKALRKTAESETERDRPRTVPQRGRQSPDAVPIRQPQPQPTRPERRPQKRG